MNIEIGASWLVVLPEQQREGIETERKFLSENQLNSGRVMIGICTELINGESTVVIGETKGNCPGGGFITECSGKPGVCRQWSNFPEIVNQAGGTARELQRVGCERVAAAVILADEGWRVGWIGSARKIINSQTFPGIARGDGSLGSGVDGIDQPEGKLAEVEVVEVD